MYRCTWSCEWKHCWNVKRIQQTWCVNSASPENMIASIHWLSTCSQLRFPFGRSTPLMISWNISAWRFGTPKSQRSHELRANVGHTLAVGPQELRTTRKTFLQFPGVWSWLAAIGKPQQAKIFFREDLKLWWIAGKKSKHRQAAPREWEGAPYDDFRGLTLRKNTAESCQGWRTKRQPGAVDWGKTWVIYGPVKASSLSPAARMGFPQASFA